MTVIPVHRFEVFKNGIPNVSKISKYRSYRNLTVSLDSATLKNNNIYVHRLQVQSKGDNTLSLYLPTKYMIVFADSLNRSPFDVATAVAYLYHLQNVIIL